MPNAASLIVRYANKYGLDPKAVLSVARGEGGLRNRQGDIGDLSGGGSFGPFQLYTQGALPARFRGNQRLADRWAWSPAGINYAVRLMSRTSARGKAGAEAISAIIKEFERPADPGSSIRNAVARYGQTNVPAPALGAGPGRRQAGGAMADPGRAFAMEILSQISQRGHVDPQGLLQFAAEWKAQDQGGTTMPPFENGGAPSSGSGLIDQALAFAHGNVGQPYHTKLIGFPGQGTHTLGNWESDNAVDVAMPRGTPIYAAFDGTIGSQFGALSSGNPRMAGLRLHLLGRKNELYYAHLSKFAKGIKPGTHVRKGQLIGYSGSANGVDHLHLGARRGNPAGWFAG